MSTRLLRAYAFPAFVAAVTIGGLVLSLVVDGWAEIAALSAIATPLVLIARALRRAMRTAPNPSPPPTRSNDVE